MTGPWHTERLLLRPFVPEDAEAVHPALDRDPEVWRFDPGHPRSLAARRATIARYAMLWEQVGFGPAGAWCRRTGRFLGQGGLNPYLYRHRDGTQTLEVEVMFKLARAAWGQGFATEIARFWVDHGFRRLGLRRIATAPERANRASVAVLERLGCRIFDDWLEPDTVIAVLEHPEAPEGERLE